MSTERYPRKAVIAAPDGLTPELKTKSRARRERQRTLAGIADHAPKRRNDLLSSLAVSYVPIEELRQAPRRVRRAESAQVARIRVSIEKFGVCQPVLISKDRTIVHGHGVVEAARAAGLTKIPVIFVEHLSPAELRLLSITLNRLGETGQWDEEALRIEFAELDPNGNCQLSASAGTFVAGILKYLAASIAVFAPSAISYLRLTPHRWSAAFNNLGYRDREAAIRICPGFGTDPAARARQMNFEFRATDAAANPHLVLATLVRAGLQGIREKLPTPQPTSEDLSQCDLADLDARGIARLPTSLDEALTKLASNRTVRSWFPQPFVDIYLAHRHAELVAIKDLTQEQVFDAYANAY